MVGFQKEIGIFHTLGNAFERYDVSEVISTQKFQQVILFNERVDRQGAPVQAKEIDRFLSKRPSTDPESSSQKTPSGDQYSRQLELHIFDGGFYRGNGQGIVGFQCIQHLLDKAFRCRRPRRKC